MKKIAVLLMITAILSKFMGFTRDIALSYFYGISSISDGYLVSQTIPVVIFGFISVGISTAFIPIYTEALKNEGEYFANEFMNSLINIFIIICIIIIILVFIFTKEIVLIFSSTFKEDILNLTIKFTRMSVISILFLSIVSIFSGFLNVNNNYIAPSLIGVPFNIVSILFIYFSTKGNLLLLSVGSIISVLFEVLYLYPYVVNKGYKYKMILGYNNKYIYKLWKLAIPAIIGVSVNQINFLVDRTIASNIIGGISVLNYSERINSLVQGLFVAPIFTILYTDISKMAAYNDTIKIKSYISRSMCIVTIFIIPITIGIMIFSNQIVDILFGRGEFDENAISITAGTVFFYSIGMIGFAWREIISRGFYSMQDTKTPTLNASFAMCINIILNVILSRFMGINGLALATSISAILSTILLIINFRKKIGSFDGQILIFTFIKILFISIIMGCISKYIYYFFILNINKFFGFILSVLIGIFVYFILLIFMNIEEVEFIKRKFKEKFF